MSAIFLSYVKLHSRLRFFTQMRITSFCTPCNDSADDRARRFETHRTPCIESADDRARRLMPRRIPCIDCAASRADKRCTPCIATEASPRARMAPSWEGLSSASCPGSPHRHHPPRPQPSRHPRPPSRRRSRGAGRCRAAIPSSSPTHSPRAPRSGSPEITSRRWPMCSSTFFERTPVGTRA